MSRASRNLAVLVLVVLVVLSACKRKKPTIPQPQSQAPTITQPVPQPAPQPAPQLPPVPQPQPPVTTTTTERPAPVKPAPKIHKHKTPKKLPPPQTEKSKTVKEGGENVPAGQLSAGIPEDEVTRQRRSAAQLRKSTEDNLRGLTRELTSDEQSMVQQIRTYLAQSRTADNDGDVERAYNLAVKAHLLSEGLIKR